MLTMAAGPRTVGDGVGITTGEAGHPSTGTFDGRAGIVRHADDGGELVEQMIWEAATGIARRLGDIGRQLSEVAAQYDRLIEVRRQLNEDLDGGGGGLPQPLRPRLDGPRPGCPDPVPPIFLSPRRAAGAG